jgi:hypothetical protein
MKINNKNSNSLTLVLDDNTGPAQDMSRSALVKKVPIVNEGSSYYPGLVTLLLKDKTHYKSNNSLLGNTALLKR